MTTSNAKILLTLLGIALIVLSVVFIVRPKNESIKGLKVEIADLQATYDDLCEKEKHKDEYIAATAEYNKQFEEELTIYPADLNQETTVMFLKGVEEEQEFKNVSVSLPRPSTFYILGQGSSADGAVVDEEDSEQYVVETTTYTISYNGSYDGLKEYLDYIASYKYRMNLSQVDIAYDGEADQPVKQCSGTVMLNAYSISGPNRTPDKPDVSVKEGKEVIFEDENGGNRSSTSFDEDNGASIASNHNLVILLNNAANDTASGIIVASNETDESTYVTSSANEVEDLKISITEEDGKKYISYAIGTKTYKSEVVSPNVTIYVNSSERVDSDDKNGVKVSIDNSTDLSVYVKVDGDDTTSPRFNISSKTGTVKVY